MSEMTVTKEALEARVKEALVEFGAEEEQVTREATWEQLDIDSLDLVELAQIIEDEYGVELREADMEKLETVGDAVDAVAARLS